MHSITSADPVIEEQAAAVAYELRNAPKRTWPYSHIVFEKILPPDLFKSLKNFKVPKNTLEQHKHIEGETDSEKYCYSISFSNFNFEKGDTFHPVLEKIYRVLSHPLVTRSLTTVFAKELIEQFNRNTLPLMPSITFIEDHTGYALLPHTDVAYKAITLLIYLAEEDADPSLGTELYIPKGAKQLGGGYRMKGRYLRDQCTRVSTVPYRPNGGLAFAPTPRTLHGAGSVETGNLKRRVIQFQLLVSDPEIKRVHPKALNASAAP